MKKNFLIIGLLSILNSFISYASEKKRHKIQPHGRYTLTEERLAAYDALQGVVVARVVKGKQYLKEKASLETQQTKGEKESIERVKNRAHSKSPSYHRASASKR